MHPFSIWIIICFSFHFHIFFHNSKRNPSNWIESGCVSVKSVARFRQINNKVVEMPQLNRIVVKKNYYNQMKHSIPHIHEAYEKLCLAWQLINHSVLYLISDKHWKNVNEFPFLIHSSDFFCLCACQPADGHGLYCIILSFQTLMYMNATKEACVNIWIN